MFGMILERMHFYIPKESTLSPTKSPAKQFICQPPLLQATEQGTVKILEKFFDNYVT